MSLPLSARHRCIWPVCLQAFLLQSVRHQQIQPVHEQIYPAISLPLADYPPALAIIYPDTSFDFEQSQPFKVELFSWAISIFAILYLFA